MNPNYPLVAKRAAHHCEYCHAPEAIFNFPFEVEHIIPVAHGGSNDDMNLALACRACNLHKSNHLDGVDPETKTAVRLFHPCRDSWDDNFKPIATAGTIVGRTPIGRATVARLRINTQTQVIARQQWMRLNLFP